MQGNTTEVIAWNKHSVRTTRTQEDSNILIEKQKTTKMLYSLSFCLSPFIVGRLGLSKPSLFHHHSQNDYSKKEEHCSFISDPERTARTKKLLYKNQ